ncbi:hypothetical protein AT6N2_C0823 [Agrobacterium tumefaciens]|nr:hypothetical protein AT6N2_C0823 [Agrobacterium tumefaciens]
MVTAFRQPILLSVVLVPALVVTALCRAGRQHHVDLSGLFKDKGHRHLVTFRERFFDVEEHHMQAAGRQLDGFSCGNDDTLFQLAHFHDVVDHGHLMDFRAAGRRRFDADQPVVGIAGVLDRHVTATHRLSRQHGFCRAPRHFEATRLHDIRVHRHGGVVVAACMIGLCGDLDGRRRAFQGMRINASGCDLIPRDLALVAAKLGHFERQVLPCFDAGNLTLHGEGVVELIRQIATLPADFNRAAFDLLAVVRIGLLIVALDDLQLPACLGLRLGGNKALRQFDLNLGGGEAAIASMRHLKGGYDGTILLSRAVDEGGVRKSLRRRN